MEWVGIINEKSIELSSLVQIQKSFEKIKHFYLQYEEINSSLQNESIFASLLYGGLGLLPLSKILYEKTGKKEYLIDHNTILERAKLYFLNDSMKLNNLCYGYAGLVLSMSNNSIYDMTLSEVEIMKRYKTRLYFDSISYFERGHIDLFYGGMGTFEALMSITKNEGERKLFTCNIMDLYLKLIGGEYAKIPFWLDMTPFERKKPADYIDGQIIEEYNLGVPHGIIGTILFLSKYAHLYYNYNSIKKLVIQIYDYMISLYEEFNTLPMIVSKNDINLEYRLAWCYGDISLAYATLLAAQSFNIPAYENFANNIIVNVESKIDLYIENVNDSALCHGNSGIAHLYAKIYNLNGSEIALNRSNYFLERILNDTLYDKSSGLTLYYDGLGKYENCYNLMDGEIGKSLVLLSNICSVKPKWDSILLLS